MRQGSDENWHPVDKDNIEETYFTDLKFSGNTLVEGNIDGSNDIFNTLKMSNKDNFK